MAISSTLMEYEMWLKLIGGSFLLYLGTKSIFSKPAEQAVEVKSNGLFQNFVSTFFLTVTNPSTILTFLALFTGMGISSSSLSGSTLLVVGVFVGSACWWVILSFWVGCFKDRITAPQLRWVNILSGLILFTFGLLAWAAIFK